MTHEKIQEAKHTLLAQMAEGVSFVGACKAANVTTATIYAWRDRDGVFDEAVKALTAKKPEKSISRRPIARKAEDVPAETVPTVIQEVCNAIRAGLPIDYCCLLANVNRGALRKWMLEDEEVAATVNKAQAQNLLWWISKLRQGAEKDWKAALAYLERIFPALFAEVRQVEISQKEICQPQLIDITPEATIKKLTEMSDEELQAIIGKGTV